MRTTPIFSSLFFRLSSGFLLALSGLSAAELTFEEGIRKRLGKLTEGETHGVAVLVARDGKIVFQSGFGLADIAKKTPVTPDTKFRIGSVTKQFTAAAILRLADDGKLSLTDHLAKFFPDFPRGGEFTLHHLLTHTSGIRSYTDKPDFIGNVSKPVEPGQLIARFKDDPPDFAPGTGFHYNNSAYFLTGEIVAKVSGKPLAAYLRETFFEPLGMKDTGIFVNASPPAGMAVGYSFEQDKATPALDWDMSWAGGAGALYSTVGDLFRWNEGLFGGKVIKEASLKLQTTPVTLPAGVDGMKYGYGLVASELRGLPALGHGGGLNGWSSDLLRLPQQHCTVVALTNAMPAKPGLEPGAITRAIAEKFLADDIKKLPPPVEDRSVDPKSYPAFAGRYDYKSAVMTVTVENSRLFAQLTGQPKHEIFPRAANEFFWKVTDAHIVFQRNEKGEVTAAQHTQNGATFKAPRLANEEVKLTGAELDAVAGDYQYGPGAVLTVSRDKDSIFAQLTGQQKFPIFPKSATEFQWRITPASIQFIKDPKGKVTKAIHHQGGGTIEAPKIK